MMNLCARCIMVIGRPVSWNPSDPTLRSHFDSFTSPFPGSQPFSQGSFIACKGFMDMDCHSDGIHCPTMLG
ncbi:hypothetical protein M8J77_021459 [Diaphorina citri]|nr:hypothetical protein M8J77_021459 [Diaphorina citri]